MHRINEKKRNVGTLAFKLHAEVARSVMNSTNRIPQKQNKMGHFFFKISDEMMITITPHHSLKISE